MENIRHAHSVDAIARAVIGGLGVHGIALVFCDELGAPALWIGDGYFDRDYAQHYLELAHRDELAALRATLCCIDGPVRVAPLIGDGVIGVLRVAGSIDRGDLAMLAAHISIRIAALGDTRTLGALTLRQREVAELVAHGCTNIEIGRMLAISANAVKKHVSRVLALLEVTNRTELAALTGRWRVTAGCDQSLPASTPELVVVVRNSSKSDAVVCQGRVA